MTTPILSIANLKVFYGVIQAIRGVTIEIKEGEIVCLIGANGAGKSTLLMSIFGYPRASSGTILFQGENITQVHESQKLITFPLLQKVVEFDPLLKLPALPEGHSSQTQQRK